MKTNFSIRPATRDDLPFIHDIFKYYVLNTTTSFYYNAPTLSSLEAKFETVNDRGLPYLVATATDRTDDDRVEEILGYAYAAPFRPPLLAYARSVEISIFVHPEKLQDGTGKALMTALLDEVKRVVHRAWEPGHEAEEICVDVRNVFAVMAFDVNGPGRETGERLLAWYERFGFRVVGRLKNVGWKDGRWVDTVYLQLDLGT